MIRSRRNGCNLLGNAATAKLARAALKSQDGYAWSSVFRPGDRVHVYEFGGPEAPRYLGGALIVDISDPLRSTYRVRFDRDSSVQVAVVASSLQGDPETVLAELAAHWAQRISRLFFGDVVGSKTTPDDDVALAPIVPNSVFDASNVGERDISNGAARVGE